jgi:signal transduction histidine kinase
MLAGATATAASDERAAGLVLLTLSLAGCAAWLWRRAVRAEAEAARLAAALEEARRRHQAGEVARVAHRLANAVAIVKANVGWLARPPEPDEPAGERAEALAETAGAVDRITALTDELRAATREAGGRRGGEP